MNSTNLQEVAERAREIRATDLPMLVDIDTGFRGGNVPSTTCEYDRIWENGLFRSR
ncbi:hypothetical protein [Sporosarcina pasteurii]|uniref:Uncharacterized protein n=1 Tax=Sporosarcina pasteurii TaxID=1474 RepID=A0A380BCZ9_SPOPA|nr:hypothetical protein [Sporosarcina pasteurii]MDS9472624.1 hypothetical protein [Sporosarcina pasteurii]SUI99280.1 Uncharacterised protein [Sporosarcina pasteurii]